MHFFFHRSLSCLVQRFSCLVETEALFLDRCQRTEYLETDKTYLLSIRCSLIAERLLLCRAVTATCQDIPALT